MDSNTFHVSLRKRKYEENGLWKLERSIDFYIFFCPHVSKYPDLALVQKCMNLIFFFFSRFAFAHLWQSWCVTVFHFFFLEWRDPFFCLHLLSSFFFQSWSWARRTWLRKLRRDRLETITVCIIMTGGKLITAHSACEIIRGRIKVKGKTVGAVICRQEIAKTNYFSKAQYFFFLIVLCLWKKKNFDQTLFKSAAEIAMGPRKMQPSENALETD